MPSIPAKGYVINSIVFPLGSSQKMAFDCQKLVLSYDPLNYKNKNPISSLCLPTLEFNKQILRFPIA